MIDSNIKSQLENIKKLYDSKTISETEYNSLKEDILFNENNSLKKYLHFDGVALKYCPECGNQVSEFAIQCVKCGYPLNSNNKIYKSGYLSNEKINIIEVSNVYAWIIAFIPIIGEFVQGFMFGFMNSFDSNHFYNLDSFWWVYFVLNSIFCIVDIQVLEKNNIDTEGKYLSLWGFFFIPVYLFKRAELLNQNQTYFWAWILTFFISFII